MLDSNVKAQLAQHLARMTHPVEIKARVDEGPKSREVRELLEQVEQAGAGKVSVSWDGQGRSPGFEVRRQGESRARHEFGGAPLGHEFTTLVLALLQAGGVEPKVSSEQALQAASLRGAKRFEVYVSLTCHNCPDTAQALGALAALNPEISVAVIDGGAFPGEVESRAIMAVPTVFLNGEPFAQGRMGVAEALAKLDAGSLESRAQALSQKAPFDALIVGGGPAGVGAAVYAARKGLRVGMLAERVGGQVLDTLAIENYISIQATEGPRFAKELEAHARAYGVEIMEGFKAKALEPGEKAAALTRLDVEGGGQLLAKTVVLAPGARWRELGVPGEREYRGRGVAYCAHCDGPLFKGKAVAVVGGGNSGVEAAIDLAGLATRVTLLEYGGALKADEALLKKLSTLANVEVKLRAKTVEIQGDGKKALKLAYEDLGSGQIHEIAAEGIFVQIGLVPNTEWLRGAVKLSAHGEIEIDAKGATSVAGIFAAGDATTVPFKQIVVAAGDGAKAALGAFETLLRA